MLARFSGTVVDRDLSVLRIETKLERRTDMKTLQRVVLVAVLAAIGGAIYHVSAQGPMRPAVAEVAKPAPSSGNTLPTSGRYAGNGGAVN